jgi:hypothetical protein
MLQESEEAPTCLRLHAAPNLNSREATLATRVGRDPRCKAAVNVLSKAER